MSPARETSIILAGGDDAVVDDALARLQKMIEDETVRGFVVCTLNRTPNDHTGRLGVSVMSLSLTPDEAINVLINAIEGLGMSRSDLRRILNLGAGRL